MDEDFVGFAIVCSASFSVVLTELFNFDIWAAMLYVKCMFSANKGVTE